MLNMLGIKFVIHTQFFRCSGWSSLFLLNDAGTELASENWRQCQKGCTQEAYWKVNSVRTAEVYQQILDRFHRKS